jgi:hypothetical protein
MGFRSVERERVQGDRFRKPLMRSPSFKDNIDLPLAKPSVKSAETSEESFSRAVKYAKLS